jgi:hypothetical protein
MKKNRNFIIVVILLAFIVIILLLTNSKTTFRRAMSDFAVDDTSNITMIFMSDKNNNSLKINRKIPGYDWVVNDKYAGQKFNINMLMETMLNIQVKQPVPVAAHNNIIKSLAANSVKVEIYQQVYRIDFLGIRLFQHEKLTKVYYVGGATQDNHGSFMLMEHSSEPFITYLPGLRGFVSPRFTPIEKYWRDYSVFRKNIHEIASVRMEFPTIPEQSFLVRNNHDRNIELISLSDNGRITDFDTLKLMNFLSGFRNLNFEAIINDIDKTQKDSIIASVPFSIITVTDTNGISRLVRIFHKKSTFGETDYDGMPLPYDPDRAYALVNEGQDFVLVQFFVFDKVLRPKSYYMKDLPVSAKKQERS